MSFQNNTDKSWKPGVDIDELVKRYGDNSTKPSLFGEQNYHKIDGKLVPSYPLCREVLMYCLLDLSSYKPLINGKFSNHFPFVVSKINNINEPIKIGIESHPYQDSKYDRLYSGIFDFLYNGPFSSDFIRDEINNGLKPQKCFGIESPERKVSLFSYRDNTPLSKDKNAVSLLGDNGEFDFLFVRGENQVFESTTTSLGRLQGDDRVVAIIKTLEAKEAIKELPQIKPKMR